MQCEKSQPCEFWWGGSAERKGGWILGACGVRGCDVRSDVVGRYTL